MKAVLAIALLGLAACSKPEGKTFRVAAASDLQKAFEELGKEFAAKTHITPQFDFGSSGLLSKQIAQGAPYALFAAANRGFAQQAVDSGRCDASTMKLYARGRLVVWTPSGVEPPKQLSDLTHERFKKIAVANPDHAPYGFAAKQALEKTGIWSKLEDEGRLVLGDSVSATMLYAKSRQADAGVVALSLAVVTDGGSFLPIDQQMHDPLDQTLVVCGGGEDADAARKLVEFIGSREGREIMTRYGFLLPGESLKQSSR
jgi:molybdate transport system substrate-binding protein